MRLRNLLFVLLLCMTVGMLGASCADDGEAGPPGPQGPPGPPGDPGEVSDMDMDTTGFYDFLRMWGSETGEISCSDPMLTGMGMFPGPETLKPLVNTAGQSAPVAFGAQCSSVLFDEIPAATPALAGIPGITGLVDAELILIKTGTAMETNKDDPKVVASSEVSLAKTVVFTKHFAGGMLAADMSTKGGNDEVFERMRLHSDCRIGTPPTAIKGEWRSVHITEVTTPHDPATKEAETDDATTDITRKVCIKLDSLPGVVKCFIEMDPAGDNNKFQQIALYDGMAEAGMEITNVVAGKDQTPDDGTDNDKVFAALPSTITNQPQVNFFGASLNLDVADTGQLCRLFEEGAKTEE